MHRFYRFACPKHWYSGHLFSFFLSFFINTDFLLFWRHPEYPLETNSSSFPSTWTVVQAGLITPLALGLANPLILSFRSQCFVQEWAWAPIQSNESQAHPGHFLKDWKGELLLLLVLTAERIVSSKNCLENHMGPGRKGELRDGDCSSPDDQMWVSGPSTTWSWVYLLDFSVMWANTFAVVLNTFWVQFLSLEIKRTPTNNLLGESDAIFHSLK